MVSALTPLAQAFTMLFDPFIDYALLSISLTVYCIIVFLVLLIGGVLGCMGVCCKRPCMVVTMFFCLFFSAFWLFGLSAVMISVNETYTPKNDQPSCADRYERVSSLVYVGSTLLQDKLCSAECVCSYQLDATI